MKQKFFILLFTALFVVSFSYSQTLNVARLDSLFQILDAKNKYMGSICIAQNGHVLYEKAIGMADIETSSKASTETRYRIGSITKMFTACMVFKAIEENKISLQQNIAEFFPAIEKADKITIAHLLNHRSGIHNFTNDSLYLTYNTQPKSATELLKIIQLRPSDFEPDSKAEYSNANYVLLSFILEKIYKKPYKTLMGEKICKPLGLSNTYYGSAVSLKDHECFSYHFEQSWQKEPETDMSIPMGAGAIVSTPGDLTKFITALFKGKIISEKSLETMKTIRDNYGSGIFQIPFYDRKGYGHTGGIDGFSSVLAYFPDSGLAVALTANGVVYENNNVMIAALSSFYGKTFTIPTFETIQLASGEMEKYAGEYSSPDFPLIITIFKDKDNLFAQATGQSAFPLEASGKDVFEFLPAGIKLVFNTSEKQMTLMQAGRRFVLTKK